MKPPSPTKTENTSLFARLGGRLQAILMHPLDAFYDHWRYLRYSNSLFRRTNDPHKLESLLVFYYHKVEKALTLPHVKPLFGLSYVPKLLDLLQQWVDKTGQMDAVVFQAGYKALRSYRNHVEPALKAHDEALLIRINEWLQKHEKDVLLDGASIRGGAVEITAVELCPANAWEHFTLLANGRRSVRNFANRVVADEDIEAAVSLAKRTPSVCNRQSWRVHVFAGADKERILAWQNGNSGFGDLASHILLLTADMRAFVSSGERNQPFIDGGMFAMSLIYALQARGIVSCPLNLSISAPTDRALRREANLPVWETPLMMLAIGYPPETLKVAASARLANESIVFFHR